MRINRILIFAVCFLCFSTTWIHAADPLLLEPETLEHTFKVLFIGNSYTFGNNLPQLFADLSASGGKTVMVDDSTFGGYTLEQHSTNTATLDKISSDSWDYVILQEQSQFPTIDYYRENSMYPGARVLDTLIQAEGAKTCFFMTWGRKYGGQQTIGAYSSPPFTDFFEMQESLRSAYTRIAVELSAKVAPVGRAWALALTLNPSVDLWTADNSHPTLKGSYLAACVFYATLFKANPTGLTYTAGLGTTEALFFQNVAYQVVSTIENSYETEPGLYYK